MPKTFSLSLIPPRILRLVGRGGTPMTPEVAAQIQLDMGELYQFIKRNFGDGSFLGLNIFENMALALDAEQQMVTQGTLALAKSFPIERAAYVTDGATLRIQFTRLFRENGMSDRFRAFSTEAEGLAFLREPGAVSAIKGG